MRSNVTLLARWGSDHPTERQAQLKLIPVYQKRREVVRTIEKFWPVALMNNPVIAFHAQHSADQRALSFLEDLWVERDKQEPRCYSIEFVSSLNVFVTNSLKDSL